MSDFNTPTMAAASMADVCERCGASLPAGANVCPQCGAPAGELATPVEQAASAAAPDSSYRTVALGGSSATSDTPEPAAAAYNPPEPTPIPSKPPAPSEVFTPPPAAYNLPPAEKKPNRLPWIIGGCCLLLFLLCCCCLMLAVGVVAANPNML